MIFPCKVFVDQPGIALKPSRILIRTPISACSPGMTQWFVVQRWKHLRWLWTFIRWELFRRRPEDRGSVSWVSFRLISPSFLWSLASSRVHRVWKTHAEDLPSGSTGTRSHLFWSFHLELRSNNSADCERTEDETRGVSSHGCDRLQGPSRSWGSLPRSISIVLQVHLRGSAHQFRICSHCSSLSECLWVSPPALLGYEIESLFAVSPSLLQR